MPRNLAELEYLCEISQIVRKRIAKYLTVINELRRDKVKKETKNPSRLPVDLRGKKTRAIRQRLSKSQKGIHPFSQSSLKNRQTMEEIEQFPTQKLCPQRMIIDQYIIKYEIDPTVLR